MQCAKTRWVNVLVVAMMLAAPASAEPIKHQVTGLFLPEREKDLRDAVATIPDLKVVAVDFKTAEVVFDYDPQKLVPKGKPEQVVQKVNDLLQSASRHTFGVKALRTASWDKLQFVEIPVAGL